MMNDVDGRDTQRLALAIGAVAAGSAVCLGALFAIGEPFGSLNDLGNATVGVLSGVLAWRLRRTVPGLGGAAATSLAVAGAALSVVGSALILSGTTGFFLAGLVSSLGFAGIGIWLVAADRSAAARAVWPSRLRATGVVAGVLMAFGVVMAPGIMLRLDDMASAPGWIWVGSVGWLGTYVVYPAWALWVGLRREPDPAHRSTAAVLREGTPGS